MASHINSIGSQRGKTRIHVYFTFLLFFCAMCGKEAGCTRSPQMLQVAVKAAAATKSGTSSNEQLAAGNTHSSTHSNARQLKEQ